MQRIQLFTPGWALSCQTTLIRPDSFNLYCTFTFVNSRTVHCFPSRGNHILSPFFPLCRFRSWSCAKTKKTPTGTHKVTLFGSNCLNCVDLVYRSALLNHWLYVCVCVSVFVEFWLSCVQCLSRHGESKKVPSRKSSLRIMASSAVKMAQRGHKLHFFCRNLPYLFSFFQADRDEW